VIIKKQVLSICFYFAATGHQQTS